MRGMRAKPWSLLDASLLALMVGVCLWTFKAPLMDIISLASHDEEQSHILLAPIVALWLVWLRRSRLALVKVQPNLVGPLVVAMGCIITWWGFQTDTYTAWHAGGIVALVGMLLSVTGLEPLRHFAPALFALAFLIPVPGRIRQTIAIPLQDMTTTVTHTCLELFGYQAAKMGNILVINGEQVAVAEACNGMRLVFSLTLVVYAFAFSLPLRPSMRLLLLILSPAVALFANIVRLVPTSLLYGMLSPEHAEMFHDISGWVMLPIALLAMVGVLQLFKWLEFPVVSFRLANQ